MKITVEIPDNSVLFDYYVVFQESDGGMTCKRHRVSVTDKTLFDGAEIKALEKDGEPDDTCR